MMGTLAIPTSRPVRRFSSSTTGKAAFDETHTAYLRTNRDTDAEDELFKLVASETEVNVTPLGRGAEKVLVTIDDVESQAYELDFPGNNPTHEIDEGEDAGLELAPVPPRTVEMPLQRDAVFSRR